ncbi:hypothetical protein H109_06416 [Trichophyton interdigitale MR816]|uniref:Uncharacterized protein n=1 Tax=Trichophyton interdigitale (strain MR816) TaxID=1215338 RepID=A0A059J1V2_TRIIM|nr:hypothetical protein H101_07292 [Trichophyton interdigitale H6]KDB21653.1 hypothetical protein H109_06416 [Trichophyton interdigitale MR816]
MAPVDTKGKKFNRPQKSSLQTPDATEKTTKKRIGQQPPLKRRSTAGGKDQTAPNSTTASKRQKQTKDTPRTSSSIALEDEGTLDTDMSSSEEPDYILAEITAVDEPKQHPADNKSSDPRIDYKLVTTILHEVAFKKKKTRITKDGVKLFTKYIESFVTEAVSRSIEEKRVNSAASMATSATRTDIEHSNYLETEDLERAYPQLMLDF